jgi:hypothetical protein
MNHTTFKTICARLIVAAAATSGLSALATQTASSQVITATVPFAFSAAGQSFPAGTYQFTFLSEWRLSIRNMQGGGERFFTVHPQNGSHASHARVVFGNARGQKNLEAVYLPRSHGDEELLEGARLTQVPQKVWLTHSSGSAGVL